jgi:hypothetical protein
VKPQCCVRIRIGYPSTLLAWFSVVDAICSAFVASFGGFVASAARNKGTGWGITWESNYFYVVHLPLMKQSMFSWVVCFFEKFA